MEAHDDYLDAAYKTFAPPNEWAKVDLRADIGRRYLSRLKRLQGLLPEPMVRELTTGMLRAASLNTGALEDVHGSDRGLTVTMIERAAWQDELVRAGEEDAVPHVQASLDAYQLVLDAATGQTPISEAWIRRLHEVALAGQPTYEVRTAVGLQQHPLELGAYKRYPNHVQLAGGGFHSYAPVSDTQPEMSGLVEALRSEEFEGLRPELRAAFVHHAITVIHPFADGNGRVARLLASVYLLRSASVPFMVWADQKVEYLAALREADRSNLAAFGIFVFDRSLASMSYASELMEKRLDDARRFGELPEWQDEDSVDEVEEQPLAARLEWILSREVAEAVRLAPRGLGSRLTFEIGPLVIRVRHGAPWDGFRFPAGSASARVTIRRGEPKAHRPDRARHFEIWEPLDSSEWADLVVRVFDVGSGPGERFDVRQRDIEPEEQAFFTERFRMWVRRQVQDS